MGASHRCGHPRTSCGWRWPNPYTILPLSGAPLTTPLASGALCLYVCLPAGFASVVFSLSRNALVCARVLQARRVVVLRADVALWATDDISQRGAALQVDLARHTTINRPKLEPGDPVRIPFGSGLRRQRANGNREAVAKNSLGKVVSCANGYYTVALQGGSATGKFRRSELELLPRTS